MIETITIQKGNKIASAKIDASVPDSMKNEVRKRLRHELMTDEEILEDRIDRIDINWKCPLCKSKSEPKRNIRYVGTGGLFGSIVKKKKYTCKDCGSDFTDSDVLKERKAQGRLLDVNNMALEFVRNGDSINQAMEKAVNIYTKDNE